MQHEFICSWRKYKKLVVIGLTIIVSIQTYSCNNSASSDEQDESIAKVDTVFERPQSGNLYSDGIPDDNGKLSDSLGVNEVHALVKPEEEYADWEVMDYNTGSSPACFNYMLKSDKTLKNKLEVKVGSNTDVVIKLINKASSKCIRYVYIRGNETYNIRNIPQGLYFLKIAYGKDWRQKVEDNICKGKFISNALYEVGEEILNFRKAYTGTSIVGDHSYKNYSVPSYSLMLDVIASDFDKKFNSNTISEEEFNKEKQ